MHTADELFAPLAGRLHPDHLVSIPVNTRKLHVRPAPDKILHHLVLDLIQMRLGLLELLEMRRPQRVPTGDRVAHLVDKRLVVIVHLLNSKQEF